MANPFLQFGLTDLEMNAAMARDPLVYAGVMELAHKVEQSLKDKAQVFGETGREEKRETPPDGSPGDFKESIHTTAVRTKTGLPAAKVGSSSPIALWQEVGTEHFPEDAIFTKTAQEFGDTTGPVFSDVVQSAQHTLRGEIAALAGLKTAGASSERIASQASRVKAARQARSSAFKASRSRRGRK